MTPNLLPIVRIAVFIVEDTDTYIEQASASITNWFVVNGIYLQNTNPLPTATASTHRATSRSFKLPC